MTIENLIIEALRVRDRFWFIQEFQLKERTDMTVTLHFIIGADLLVQVFYSQRSDRLSLALVVHLVAGMDEIKSMTTGICTHLVRPNSISPHRKGCPHNRFINSWLK